jgi:hypothetical protein
LHIRAVASRARRWVAIWRAHLLATVVLAIGGTLFFGLLHAVLIEPIWLRLFGGLPFALLASGAITWCYHELLSSGHLRTDLASGATFGAAIWLALLPMTLFAAALRASGLRPRLGSLEAPLEFLLAAVTGALVGFAVGRSLRLSLAAAVCMAAVVLAMAGPIAFGFGATHRLLLLGFLPVYAGAGAVLSFLGQSSSQRLGRAA